jgi:hypothetical protein
MNKDTGDDPEDCGDDQKYLYHLSVSSISQVGREYSPCGTWNGKTFAHNAIPYKQLRGRSYAQKRR